MRKNILSEAHGVKVLTENVLISNYLRFTESNGEQNKHFYKFRGSVCEFERLKLEELLKKKSLMSMEKWDSLYR